MLLMNLLIEKTAATKLTYFRIIHNICKINLTLRYFSFIYISYKMYITLSCVTCCLDFHKEMIFALVLPENDIK